MINITAPHQISKQRSHLLPVALYPRTIWHYKYAVIIIINTKAINKVISVIRVDGERTYEFPVDELYPFVSISGCRSSYVKSPPRKHQPVTNI